VVSASLIWQRRMMAAGNCKGCGRKRNRHKTLCDRCQNEQNDRTRSRQLNLVREGKCRLCGRERGSGDKLCDECMRKDRDRKNVK